VRLGEEIVMVDGFSVLRRDHEKVERTFEEQCLWPVVRQRMPGGNDLADEAMLREFIAAVREHVTFEETKIWPGLREALSTQEVNELGDNLMTAEDNVPSRAS